MLYLQALGSYPACCKELHLEEQQSGGDRALMLTTSLQENHLDKRITGFPPHCWNLGVGYHTAVLVYTLAAGRACVPFPVAATRCSRQHVERVRCIGNKSGMIIAGCIRHGGTRIPMP